MVISLCFNVFGLFLTCIAAIVGWREYAAGMNEAEEERSASIAEIEAMNARIDPVAFYQGVTTVSISNGKRTERSEQKPIPKSEHDVSLERDAIAKRLDEQRLDRLRALPDRHKARRTTFVRGAVLVLLSIAAQALALLPWPE